MSLEKALEKMSKDILLLSDDLNAMLAEEDPENASRKSLEPSTRLVPEGEEKEELPSDPLEKKQRYMLDYIEKRFGDILWMYPIK